MKKIKICFAVFTFLFLFLGVYNTPVHASEDLEAPSSYQGQMPSKLLTYYIILRRYVSDGSIDGKYHQQWYSYDIISSDKPFVFNNDGYYLPVGAKYTYVDAIYYENKFSHFNDDYEVRGDFCYVTREQDSMVRYTGKLTKPSAGFESNHTIKHVNGSDFFLVPLLTAQVVKPLAEVTKANSLVIIGGTICLVVLGISLVVFSRRFWVFLRQ